MSFYYRNTEEKGHKLYAIGPLEISLIVLAVILIFGVGKIAHVGGALGKSIREFRKEKDRIDETSKLTTKEPREETTSPEVESKEESRD